MRNYSANLYRKFVTRTMNTLKDDDFYEYFMKVVESGARFYGQKNEVLVKTVDPTWVDAIGDCMIPFENIIKKPRKFIRREESIVPIELARKVGSDAVKHLATHTHFISRIDKEGGVVPTKILNVYNEENYEIYENRFIITLLGRVNQFLDRRYDALFGTTGDEFQSVLKVDSGFVDNDEKIEYNLVLKIHQGQRYLDNKSNDPAIYGRIETIRMMLAGFKKSEFYMALMGTNPVRSPINKTNLITKEPNFRKCYDLWKFLDRYDEVGYTIERRSYDVDFPESYIEELNTLTLYNYLIMKNHLSAENNKAINPAAYKRKRVIKPKFIKNIIEEFVSDYDVNETELRQMLNEAISKTYQKIGDEEAEILGALQSALSAELKRQEQEDEEAEILEAIERAISIEAARDEEREREEQARRAAQAEEELRRREREREQLRREREKEKQRIADEKAKAQKKREQERARAQKQRELEDEKKRKAREREAEKRRRAREKQEAEAAERLIARQLKAEFAQRELERQRAEAQRQREEQAALRAKQKAEAERQAARERREREKAREKARAEKARAEERERQRLQIERERAKAAALKQQERERQEAQRAREKARQQRQQELQAEKLRLQKERERRQAERQAAGEAERQRLLEQKAREQAERQAAKEAERQRLLAQKAREQAERQAAKETERRRLLEARARAAAEAKVQRLAEQQRLAAERQAAREADRQRLLEQKAREQAERQAAREAERQRLAAQKAAERELAAARKGESGHNK